MAGVSARRRGLNRVLLAGCGLLLTCSFASLANWQHSRAAQKEAWLARVEAARAAPPRALAEALSDPATQGVPIKVDARIELRGTPRVLLDNQQREGRVGVREYAFVRAYGTGPWLLADLGWLPLAPDRRLPELAPLPEALDATGLLTDLPGQGIKLAANPTADTPLVLLNYLDITELAAQTGLDVAPRLLRLDPALPIGHARDLDVLPNTLPPEKHLGYALQWAALALAAFVITLVLFFRSRA